MSSQLDEVDQMLLGEGDHHGPGGDLGHETTTTNCGANPLIATAGTLVQVDRRGNEINGTDEVNNACKASVNTIPQKRGTMIGIDGSGDELPVAARQSPNKKAKVNSTQAAGAATPAKSKKGKTNATTVKAEGVDDAAETPAPQTPSPKKRNAKKKGDTDESVSPSKSDGGMTVRDTPRKRAAPKTGLAAPRGIPKSWENADTVDRMLVTMKEAGESWAAIREAWTKETGEDTAGSTLPNRYTRIRVNMMRLKPEDAPYLLTAKREVENEFWAFVASKMEASGADKYPTAFLQKKFKEFEDEAAKTGTTIDAIFQQIAPTETNGANGLITPEDEVDEKVPNGNAIDVFVEKDDDE